MDVMWHHWAIIRDKSEVAILDKYSRFTRRFTLVITRKHGTRINILIFTGYWSIIGEGLIVRNLARRDIAFVHNYHNVRPRFADVPGYSGAVKLVPSASPLHLNGTFCRSGQILSSDFAAHSCFRVGSNADDNVRRHDSLGLHGACLRNAKNR